MNLKVLPLEFWMIFCDEEELLEMKYIPCTPSFGRPGIYLWNGICWFEKFGGQAWNYSKESFTLTLDTHNASELSKAQAQALSMIVGQKLATKKQRKLLHDHKLYLASREIYRNARKERILFFKEDIT